MIGVFIQLNSDSLLAKSEPIGYVVGESCWEWVGALDDGGYGRVKGKPAHRIMYERNGNPDGPILNPIPDGLHIDHLCRNRACGNPGHMEPVTLVENVMRGEGACAKHARKTHCPKGHELSGGNLVPSHLKRGERRCLICHNERCRRWNQSHREQRNVWQRAYRANKNGVTNELS